LGIERLIVVVNPPDSDFRRFPQAASFQVLIARQGEQTRLRLRVVIRFFLPQARCYRELFPHWAALLVESLRPEPIPNDGWNQWEKEWEHSNQLKAQVIPARRIVATGCGIIVSAGAGDNWVLCPGYGAIRHRRGKVFFVTGMWLAQVSVKRRC
jgi:hypothetical protein